MKKHAHLIGLCGAGMRSLVDFLLADGWSVSGSDQSMTTREKSALAKKNVIAFTNHHAKNLPLKTTLLVHSLAIPVDNIERRQAVKNNILCVSYVEFLGKLFEEHRGIGVAGTHGKTTTTAILSFLLRNVGEDISVICGGKIQDEVACGYHGKSELLIAECCEFRQSFLHYSPFMAVLTGIETDHFDCYPNEKSLVEAFAQFCAQIDPAGLLVINADCQLTNQAAAHAKCRVARFSLDPTNNTDWRITSTASNKNGSRFTVCSPCSKSHSFTTELYGIHQIANCLAAIIIANQLGNNMKAIANGLKKFPGVERRFEIRGEYGRVICVDDYAHHPTEIEATIQAARQKFGTARLIIAFQAHQILRTESLLSEFAAALAKADFVFVLPVYAAREKEDGRAESVAQKLVDNGNSLYLTSETKNQRFEYTPSLDHLRSSLDDALSTHEISTTDVFLTLGAGDIDRIYYEWLGFIPRNNTI